MGLRRVGVRMTIEPPVHAGSIDVVKRVPVQFAPLDIDPGGVGGAEPVGELDVEFGR